ncbi:MAG: hypothetical protein HC817_14725 [Saprospiraceae bacterium]|nr:hypothetical protein [Saprospiraceae bacterium]
MKKISIKFLIAASVLTFLWASCEKNEFALPETQIGTGAKVRFINTAFNINDANGGAMLLNLFVNGSAINGTQRLSTGVLSFF